MKMEEALAQRQWYVIDAQGKVLGRMASEIAKILRGKNKPIFTPNARCGDFVIVVNARGLKLTGKKLQKKVYYRHTEYPGASAKDCRKDAGRKAGGSCSSGRQGNVAKEPAEQKTGHQTQGLCGP